MDEGPRVATQDEAGTITELVVTAFHNDPTWAWAFPDPYARREQHRAFWRLFVEGALRYPWVWLAAGDVATSIWIPPGGNEMSEDQEAAMAALLADLPDPWRAGSREPSSSLRPRTLVRSRITTSACSRPMLRTEATATA